MNDMNYGQRTITGRGGLRAAGIGTGGMEPCMVGGHMRGESLGGTSCGCNGSDARPGYTPGMTHPDARSQGRCTQNNGMRPNNRPGCGCGQNGGSRPDNRPGCGCGQNGGTPARGNRGLAVPVGQEVNRGTTCALGCHHDLLDEIRATEFALCEVVLYLDVYPDCCEALAMYHELIKTRDALVKKYEQEVGPLTCLGNVSCTSWDWVKDPFPWAYEAND